VDAQVDGLVGGIGVEKVGYPVRATTMKAL
jgi:hypothetical protein